MALLEVRYPAPSAPPDEVATWYAQQADGSWLLNTNPVFDDTTQLKKALNDERRLHKEKGDALADLQRRFEGVDPQQAKDAQEQLTKLKANLQDKQILDAQGMEALRAAIEHESEQKTQRMVQAKERELAQVAARLEEAESRWRTDRIRTRLTEVAGRLGVQRNALDDVLRAGAEVFTRLDDQGNPVAVDSHGETIYGKDGAQPKTPDEWLGDMKVTKASVWWPQSSGTGRGGANGTGGYTGPDLSSIEDPRERITRYRQQLKQREGARR